MRALLIDNDVAAAIIAANDRARANPIPLATLQAHSVPDQNVTLIKLANRAPGKGDRPPSEQVLIPEGYRMAISYEQQPAGLVAHFSFSIDSKSGALPQPVAVELLLGVLKFKMTYAANIWLEEYLVNNKPGGVAVNVLFLVKPTTS